MSTNQITESMEGTSSDDDASGEPDDIAYEVEGNMAEQAEPTAAPAFNLVTTLPPPPTTVVLLDTPPIRARPLDPRWLQQLPHFPPYIDFVPSPPLNYGYTLSDDELEADDSCST
jgi:hypothetical protein